MQKQTLDVLLVTKELHSSHLTQYGTSLRIRFNLNLSLISGSFHKPGEARGDTRYGRWDS